MFIKVVDFSFDFQHGADQFADVGLVVDDEDRGHRALLHEADRSPEV